MQDSEPTFDLDADGLPAGLRRTAARLAGAGHAVYLVGGCLRDLVRGARPHDWDLATSALPAAVIDLFPRTVPTGACYGTVMVLDGEATYEVTTLREEVGYSDCRHPDRVVFTGDLARDLERRDFTINAMAVDLASGAFHDPQGGLADLEARLLRAVGEPRARFREDALRLLRGCRLAAELELEIEPATARAMAACASGIEAIAGERVRDELLKLMARARRPSRGLLAMLRSGLLARLVPELLEGAGVTQNRYHRYDVFTHALMACDRVPAERPLVRLAALFHDVAKPRTRAPRPDAEDEATFYGHDTAGAALAAQVLARLRFARRERERVTHLVRHHLFQYGPEWSAAAVRRFIRRVGVEHLDDLFALRAADAAASGRAAAGASAALTELRARIAAELAAGGGFPPRLALDGRDVMRLLELAPGPAVGRWLARLEEVVLERPQLNTHAALAALLRRWAEPANAAGPEEESE